MVFLHKKLLVVAFIGALVGGAGIHAFNISVPTVRDTMSVRLEYTPEQIELEHKKAQEFYRWLLCKEAILHKHALLLANELKIFTKRLIVAGIAQEDAVISALYHVADDIKAARIRTKKDLAQALGEIVYLFFVNTVSNASDMVRDLELIAMIINHAQQEYGPVDHKNAAYKLVMEGDDVPLSAAQCDDLCAKIHSLKSDRSHVGIVEKILATDAYEELFKIIGDIFSDHEFQHALNAMVESDDTSLMEQYGKQSSLYRQLIGALYVFIYECATIAQA